MWLPPSVCSSVDWGQLSLLLAEASLSVKEILKAGWQVGRWGSRCGEVCGETGCLGVPCVGDTFHSDFCLWRGSIGFKEINGGLEMLKLSQHPLGTATPLSASELFVLWEIK